MPGPVVHIDEIDDVTEAHAVHEIPERAAQDQHEAHGGLHLGRAQTPQAVSSKWPRRNGPS